jgi:hypothetical protein
MEDAVSTKDVATTTVLSIVHATNTSACATDGTAATIVAVIPAAGPALHTSLAAHASTTVPTTMASARSMLEAAAAADSRVASAADVSEEMSMTARITTAWANVLRAVQVLRATRMA